MSVGARLVAGLAALLVLAACGEKPQILDTSGKKTDEAPWAVAGSADPAFAAPGWKAGDKTAWTEQIHQRNQAQNDYAR
jgi:hypothetical protein